MISVDAINIDIYSLLTQRMELLSPTEREIVKHPDCPVEVLSYVIAIKRLSNAVDINNHQKFTILSLSHDIQTAMSQPGVQMIKLGDDYSDMPSQLRALSIRFSNSTRSLQNQDNTPDDLLLGLTDATPEWFNNKANFLEKRADLYTECITENNIIINNLRRLEIELELAISHSQTLAAHGL
jgi:hypothetical protein